MPGFDIVTNAPATLVQQAAVHFAQTQGFKVTPESNWAFKAHKGSKGTALLAGGLFVAYCRFRVAVAIEPTGVVHLTVERNNPAWTGVAGVMRVKKRAQKLAEAVASGLASQGAAVYQVRSY